MWKLRRREKERERAAPSDPGQSPQRGAPYKWRCPPAWLWVVVVAGWLPAACAAPALAGVGPGFAIARAPPPTAPLRNLITPRKDDVPTERSHKWTKKPPE